MKTYGGLDAFPVDQWVTYAMQHAAPELEFDLRVCRVPICRRPFHYFRTAAGSDGDLPVYRGKHPVAPEEVDVDDKGVASSDDDDETASGLLDPPSVLATGTVPRRLFSCAALRSLRLGSCRLSPPAVISLPSLEALHLTHVPDEEEHFQRLISASPHLADLTLEACATVTRLSLLDNRCLRRLVLRCCHKLATVTVDAPKLHFFEYRGGVPGNSFLTLRGGLPSITSCKMDVCAVCLEKEATSEEDLAALGSFLQPFAPTTKRLDLNAARMGSCFVALPAFPALRRLQLNGRVLRYDVPADVTARVCRILRQAPALELLTLFFEPAPLRLSNEDKKYYRRRKEGDLLDVHHLHYSQYDTLNYETVATAIPPCLENRVRRISLAHYQGGRAQRTLARFLLRNARVLDKLYCDLAEGPLWIQTKLMREMEGWVVNDGATKEFH